MNSPSSLPPDDLIRERLRSGIDLVFRQKSAWIELRKPDSPANRPGGESDRKVLLPGSFNPLHRGHHLMAQLAARKTGEAVWFELSVCNADKPPTTAERLAARLERSLTSAPDSTTDRLPAAPFGTGTFAPFGLILTSRPRFLEKARLFPGAAFALGVDTAIRLVDPRFYENSLRQRDNAIAEIADLDCRFLVFGRLLDQVFSELGNTRLPQSFLKLCESIPAEEFRVDLSSSELRNQRPD